MNPQSVLLALCAALLAVAGAALMAARLSKAECARLRIEAAEGLRAAEAARAEAQVIRAQAEGHARAVGERDERLGQVAREVEGLRRQHQDAERRCAEAESRCATTTEAVTRLEAAAVRLREDHAEAVRVLREEGAATLAAVRSEGNRTAERLRSVEEEFARLGQAHAKLQSERDERLASAEREVQRLASMREEMSERFKALAAETLQNTGAQFSEAHHQKLTELLSPFREQVNRFETELREVHSTAKVDRELLGAQLRELTTRTEMVSQEAVNLTRALKGDKQRQGAWGEAQLERYLEHMGYVRDVDYVVQSTRKAEDGDRLRPDVILRMPGGRALVIDSKVSLVSYAAAIDAGSEEERARHLRDHVRNVKARIDELAARGYQNLEEGAVEWVLLFMPIEGAVSAAWAHEADIASYAMERRIGIAYPTTLLMALRTVKHLWDIEKRNSNAEDIADRAGKLYDKVVGFVESFSAVGGALERAKASHDKAMGQLRTGSGNIIGQVEKLKKLGAKTQKSLSVAFDADPEDGSDEARLLVLPGEAPEPSPGVRPAE